MHHSLGFWGQRRRGNRKMVHCKSKKMPFCRREKAEEYIQSPITTCIKTEASEAREVPWLERYQRFQTWPLPWILPLLFPYKFSINRLNAKGHPSRKKAVTSGITRSWVIDRNTILTKYDVKKEFILNGGRWTHGGNGTENCKWISSIHTETTQKQGTPIGQKKHSLTITEGFLEDPWVTETTE